MFRITKASDQNKSSTQHFDIFRNVKVIPFHIAMVTDDVRGGSDNLTLPFTDTLSFDQSTTGCIRHSSDQPTLLTCRLPCRYCSHQKHSLCRSK